MPPTQEEIDEWAAREHQRRAAWMAGPSAEEQQDWARRYRRRATLGLEESRLGPSRDNIEHWAACERKRRAAWLAGPSDAEKHQWSAQQQRRQRTAAADAPPAEGDVEAWATRERQRRREWLEGPSEAEKQQWAQRQTGGLFDELRSLPRSLPAMLDVDLPDAAQRWLRDAELVGKGALYTLSRAPLALWSYFMRAGKDFEEELYQEPRRRRVRY